MASLRDTVKDYQEELRDGIAWVAFWKTGRSWNAEYFHLEMSDILYPEDRSRMEEIKQADPAAVVVNGYYSGYLGEDRNLDELTAGVRRHYENGYSNIGEFIEAHDDRLPPELIEEARAAAHAAGLPFSEKAYRDGEEPDPYLFDGSMSMEDYELMHRMIEKERSEHMEQPILSGYLSNLGKYTEGRPAGEWVSFPTTAEHLKEVFDRIGIDGKNYGELHITEYQSSIAGLAGKLTGVGIPMGLQYSITGIGSVILQTAVNGLGSIYVASMTAGSKINIFLACPFDALGQTMAPYAGQNIGARKLDRVGKGLRAACIIGFIVSGLMVIVVKLFGDQLTMLFLDEKDPVIMQNSTQFLIIVSAFYCLLTLVNTVRFTIQGMGFSSLAIIAGVMEMIARGIAGMLLVPAFGYLGACYSSPLAWLLADAFLIPAFFLCKRKVARQLEVGKA